MKYAFIDSQSIVVQLIVGDLDENQRAQFLRDYSSLFDAREIVAVEADVFVWIGGGYDSTSGVFSPPPSPESESVIEEPTI